MQVATLKTVQGKKAYCTSTTRYGCRCKTILTFQEIISTSGSGQCLSSSQLVVARQHYGQVISVWTPDEKLNTISTRRRVFIWLSCSLIKQHQVPTQQALGQQGNFQFGPIVLRLGPLEMLLPETETNTLLKYYLTLSTCPQEVSYPNTALANCSNGNWCIQQSTIAGCDTSFCSSFITNIKREWERCSTAVEHMPHNREIVGSIPTGCWAFFLLLSSVKCNVSSNQVLLGGAALLFFL